MTHVDTCRNVWKSNFATDGAPYPVCPVSIFSTKMSYTSYTHTQIVRIKIAFLWYDTIIQKAVSELPFASVRKTSLRAKLFI